MPKFKVTYQYRQRGHNVTMTKPFMAIDEI